MWYVFGATGVALTGIGNATVKRGTLANRGTSAFAIPGAARSRTPGNASIPPAPTAPLIRNCRLEIRPLVMGCLLLPPKTTKTDYRVLGSRLRYWLSPSLASAHLWGRASKPLRAKQNSVRSIATLDPNELFQ